MKTKPQTIDQYLAPLSSEKRAALEKLRRDIKAAAPKAEECISYNIPRISSQWKITGRLWRRQEPLRFLSRSFPGASPPG